MMLGRSRPREAGLHRGPGRVSRRRGERRPAARARPALGPAARRPGPHRAAAADAAVVSRRAHAALRGGDDRGGGAGGAPVAGRGAVRAPAPDAVGHPRGDHAGGIRLPGARPAGRAARAARENDRRDHADAAHGHDGRARPRAGGVGRALPASARAGGRDADRRGAAAPRRRRPGRARRRALAAGAGASRGRAPDERQGASRRADHPAGGGPRDHGHVPVVGDRAARPPSREVGAPARGGTERGGHIRGRGGEGDAAPAPGAADRGAAADPAGRDRGLATAGRHIRHPLHPPRAPAARRVSRAARVPAGALPRPAGRHLHVDSVRRRGAPLPRRDLCAVRDEDRVEGDRPRGRAAAGPAGVRARRAACDHARTRARRPRS